MARNHSRSSARPAAASARTPSVNTYPESQWSLKHAGSAAPRRQASTAAPPVPAAAPAPVYVPQREGLLTQIATTAAGVAAGHVAGRMITGLFTGGAPDTAPTAQPVEGGAPSLASQRSVAPQCQEYSRLFMQCMDQNNNQTSTCQDYLDMMKSCQQQAV